MAFLIEGSQFLTKNSQKGFTEYVDRAGLVQNKNVDYNTSPKEVSWIDGTEGNDWIAAPTQSTHKWVLKGNAGNDFIQGTDKNSNWIFGHEGNDYIHGSATFKDYLNGGNGDDKIFGYGGNDKLIGGDGDDDLLGGDGNDRLLGGAGDDLLQGGDGNDILLAGRGSNTYYGGAGADQFGLMKKHDQNVIADFDHSEGDQLLIRKEHIDSVEVQFAGNLGSNGEAHFWLQSERGLTGIQTTAGTTVENILGAIAAM